jgi:L-malate glycosyltransferase
LTLPASIRQKHARAAVLETPRRRILHLINNFEIGGTERQAVELLKRLDRDRYDIHLAAIRDNGPLRAELLSSYPDIHEFPLSSFYNINALKQFHRLHQLLLSARIDILHTHDFYAGVLGTVAARWTGVRVIVSQRHLRLSERSMHEWGRRLINSLADRVLVNAQAIRTHLIASTAVPEEKIVVIHNGITLQEISSYHEGLQPGIVHDQLCALLGLHSGVQLVGSVGNLRPVKGHRYLIEAAAQVIHSRPETHFIIVGEGEQRGQIEAYSRQLGIASHVHLLGHRTDAIHIMGGFDLAVLKRWARA